MKYEQVCAIYEAELAKCAAAPAAEAARVEKLVGELDREIVKAGRVVQEAQEGIDMITERVKRRPEVVALADALADRKKQLELHQAELDALTEKRGRLLVQTDARSVEAHAYMGTRTRVHEFLQAEHPDKSQADLWPQADKIVADAGITETGIA